MNQPSADGSTMSNKITYTKQILVPSTSILGGYRVKTIRVTRKSYNRKTSNVRSKATAVPIITLLISIALCGYATLWQPQIEPLAKAQDLSAVQTMTERVEGAKITDAGQASTSSANLSEKQQILNYIVEKFGDRADAAIAMVYKCENSTFDQSRTNTNRNGTTDYGIFQINSIHEQRYGAEFKTDWKANIDVAYEIYKSHGNSFRPWTCAGITGETNYLGK